MPTEELELAAFSDADRRVFTSFQPGSSWTSIPPDTQERLRSIRRRLKVLSAQLAVAVSPRLQMSSIVSTLNPNGRAPQDLWCCVFPQQVPNKSFALQFAVILSGDGAE